VRTNRMLAVVSLGAHIHGFPPCVRHGQRALAFVCLSKLFDMAAHVENLLDIILSLDFHDIASFDGKPVVPSSEIYAKISDITKQSPDNSKHLKPKYVYVILQKNRYGIWDKILKFFNFKIDSSNQIRISL